MKITYVEQLTQLGPQFLMASLFAAAITTKEELFSSIKYLTYVLFVSFVVLGFYQYFTQSLLVSWVNEKDVAVYQATYDLQRFTSITEMDPANTANGIMFVIILLMEKAFERKIDAIILITAALAALFLTYTRMSYVAFILVLGYYFYRHYSYHRSISLVLKRIISVVIILVIVIVAFNIPSMLSQSIRIGDDTNALYRFIQWGYFIQNFNQFLFGVGYSNVNVTSVSGYSYENYFMQTFAALGVYSVVLYALIFWRFIKNLKSYAKEMENLRLCIILMMIAFNLNMLTSVGSENLFFLIFGLSFAFYNVNIKTDVLPLD